jgi:translation elongation factor P/translation initiation factor 5A
MDTSDLKKGLKFMYDGHPWVCVDFQFVKPGKGQAFTRTKMRHLLTGSTVEKNIRSNEKIEPADAEDRSLHYIYQDGDSYVFMHRARHEGGYGQQRQQAGDRFDRSHGRGPPVHQRGGLGEDRHAQPGLSGACQGSERLKLERATGPGAAGEALRPRVERKSRGAQPAFGSGRIT